MAFFRDSGEVCAYIGQMFELFVEEFGAEAALKESGLVVRLGHTAPDCVIVVDFPNRKVFYNAAADSATTPNVDMLMNSDDAHLFWLGKLNFPNAMARRQVRMSGSTAKAMKLLPLTEPLSTIYRALLAEAGRDDLIAAS
jgi:hypothetical protein